MDPGSICKSTLEHEFILCVKNYLELCTVMYELYQIIFIVKK